ncbi:MAG: hypothetical protein ABEK50_17035 [bacterium]
MEEPENRCDQQLFFHGPIDVVYDHRRDEIPVLSRSVLSFDRPNHRSLLLVYDNYPSLQLWLLHESAMIHSVSLPDALSRFEVDPEATSSTGSARWSHVTSRHI